MRETYSVREKTRQLLVILLPILITQLSLYAMNFFDTVMSGHASPNDLAGVAIGSSIWMPVYTGLSGIMLAITPIIAQLAGARSTERMPFTVIQGAYLALALSIVVFIAGSFTLRPILDMMELEPTVRDIAYHYLIAIGFGIAPLFISMVFRCFIDALGYTRVTMLIMLISLPINVALNYVFIYGKFGFPRLGGVGAGYASAITYWCIAFLSIYVIHRMSPFASYRIFRCFYRVAFSAWKEQLKIGIPIGFSIFFETSIFAAVTLLMSEFSTVTIAAHQAAMNFASCLYMVPMSIAMALTIAVGFEVGARRFKDAVQYSYLGIGMAVTMALVCACLLFFFNEQVAGLYTTDAEVLELTMQFLIYALFFQLSDAVAAPIQGVLRGYKDVNIVFLIAFVSYWLIGLPVGYMLANYTSLGAFGYWIGLITGLLFGAIGLSLRLVYTQRKFYHVSKGSRTERLDKDLAN
ncbi:MATE family efflux transporter [Aneurinibacillus thermoaerophilus]|uniref:Probable multidrug resistance protein NorM n=1 Tax=Aneurinibacillus thermoaerophilus TaxID=143495 RepID=A0A1G7YYK0_ANETH|nr:MULTISPECIES: MATE family efflux transporter [Aneurinibacillus]AMA73137.1 MATE family efflux transporter [Aneurinibacillus sp. XH2]MED0756159.1 MATE family efflux transporter [Aneurinibacillus thermoaerophilus]MED0762392.1 MATE family efflux transporter [Aneurinibacillus thermoaerophilus]SDH01652.1 multidrug resistance protein, MATE family [Aneurinibacillus thermoaerophilus]